jgi:GT2 family glycosyltransferase
MEKISIIIVNYNSGTYITKCVESILNTISADFEIIVWDNNSDDDSLDLLEKTYGLHQKVKIFKCDKNLGFAKANNNASALANGTIFHFLNPDTIVNKKLETLYIDFLKSEMNHVCVTSLVEESLKQLKTTHLLPTIGNYIRSIFSKRKAGYWSIGASIVIPKDIFIAIGKWSEEYFMYAEDLDLFYSLYKNKIPVRYFDTEIIHVGKISSETKWTKNQRAEKIENSYRHFYKKHKISYQYYILRPIQLAYMLIVNKDEFLSVFRAFRKVIFSKTKRCYDKNR